MINWNSYCHYGAGEGEQYSEYGDVLGDMFRRMAEQQAYRSAFSETIKDQDGREYRVETEKKTDPKRLQAIRDILGICNYASAKGWMARLRQVSAHCWACDFENAARREFVQGHGQTKEQALAQACVEFDRRF